MARIPDHIIDEILTTARIEEVIGEFVSLKKKGANYMGLSPFTDEKTPSFSVSPSKQIFKCFSTGKGGTVVSFLMEKEHYSYPEALRWLAEKYNIELPKEEEPSAEQIAIQSERDSLFIINDFAKNHFHENLMQHEEGKMIGLSYFLERGFTKETIELFQLGFCLQSGHATYDAILNKGYKLEYAENLGLIKSKDERYFDFFRGRVMFPIHSVSGRILGFGGRILTNDKKTAKYFNSPESLIYNKSEILYGLYFAKNAIIKYDNCFLVEGYTDVISLYQAGIHNVVSSSGTSLTKEQIKLIRRYTNNVTILYDGDAAGIKASFRGIDLILEEGLQVQVVLFPDGDDPDSYAKKVSQPELEDYIKENKKDFISFKAELLLADGNDDPLTKVKLVQDIIQSIALIPDQITRSVLSKEIATKFDIDHLVIQQELAKNRKSTILPNELKELEAKKLEKPIQVQKINRINENNSIDKEEFDLLRFLLKYPDYSVEIEHIDTHGKKEIVEVSVAELIVDELQKDQLYFRNQLHGKIFNQVIQELVQKNFLRSSYFLKSDDNEIVQLVSSLETEKYELSSNWLKLHKIETSTELDKLKMGVLNAIYAFKMKHIQLEINELNRKISEENIDDEIMIHMQKKINFERIKMQLAKELGRIILY